MTAATARATMWRLVRNKEAARFARGMAGEIQDFQDINTPSLAELQ